MVFLHNKYENTHYMWDTIFVWEWSIHVKNANMPLFKHVRPTKRIHTVWYNIAHVSPCRCVVSVCEETHNNLTHNSCECLDLEHDMYTKCFLLTLKWLNVLTKILVLLFVPQILRLNKWAKNTWINPCCKNVLTRNGLCYLIKPKKWR